MLNKVLHSEEEIILCNSEQNVLAVHSKTVRYNVNSIWRLSLYYYCHIFIILLFCKDRKEQGTDCLSCENKHSSVSFQRFKSISLTVNSITIPFTLIYLMQTAGDLSDVQLSCDTVLFLVMELVSHIDGLSITIKCVVYILLYKKCRSSI
jgi:hypothetical protein